MKDQSRRNFLKTIAAASVSAGSLSLLSSCSRPEDDLGYSDELITDLNRVPDRIWIGPDFWGNRLQDWRVRDGRIECVTDEPFHAVRTVHLITREVQRGVNSFRLSARTGIIARNNGKGWSGFLVGAGSGKLDYRAAALVHCSSGPGGGLLAVLNTESGKLEFRNMGADSTGAEFPLLADSSGAHFRIEGWDDSRDWEYRILLRGWDKPVGSGDIRKDPADKSVISCAALTGMGVMGLTAYARDTSSGLDPFAGRWTPANMWFPHADLVRNIKVHNPDILFFTGDQIYEIKPTPRPYTDRFPILDYLYKWYLWCWSFGELNRDPGAPEYTGDFKDRFGNHFRMIAVANPQDFDVYHTGIPKGLDFPSRPQENRNEDRYCKGDGYGIVRFDKKAKKTIIECWPYNKMPPADGSGRGQFSGWPVEIRLESGGPR